MIALFRLAPVLLVAPALALVPVQLRGRKLNGPLGTVSVVGDVVEFRSSPDGAWAVYLADQDVDGRTELYSARRDGSGAIVKLNGTLVTGGQVAYFEITPDGSRVVYRADQDVDGREELYSAPIDGSAAAVKLDGPLVPGGSIVAYEPFVLTSNGQTLLYVAEQDVVGEQHLYRVPTDGSAAATAIATPMVPGGDVFGTQVVPGDAAVVLLGTLRAAGFAELFRVPIDGSSAPVPLHPPLQYGDVNSFEVSPDGTWVVYRSDDNVHLQIEVFSVPLDGSAAPVKLSGPLASTLADVRDASIDPSSTRVIYRAKQDSASVEELYSAPIDGSAAAVKLSAPLASGHAILLYPPEASYSPDGSRVAYLANPGGSYRQLYSAPTDGSAPATLLSLTNGYVGQARVAPDGGRVVFTGTQPGGGSNYGLYSVPTDGSAAPVRLNDTAPDQARVGEFVVSGDSTTVVYASGVSGSLQEPYVHAVAMDGSSAPVPLAAGQPWTDVDAPVIDEASASALFLGDIATPGTDELFAAPLGGLAPPGRVSGELLAVPGTGEVQNFSLAPDGNWLVYIDPLGVHGVNVRAEEPARLLSPPELASAPNVQFRGEVLFSHDREFVFFTVGVDAYQLLYRAPLRGDGPTVLLHSQIGDANNRFFGFRLTPDGAHLVYRHFLFDYFGPPNHGSVYSVAADGSSAPVLLDSGVSSSGLEITPDGTRAVFPVGGTDFFGFTDHELLSAPPDGSASPTEVFVNGPLQYSGDLQLAAGGTRVLYRTWSDTTFVTELWSSTLDGSSHVSLADGFPTSFSTRLTHVRVGPVDTSLAYVRQGAGAYELYHGPVDGSAPATLLASLPLSRRFDDLLFTPDGSRIVYLADADVDVDEQYELYSVPTDGSQAPVKVNGPLVSGGDVTYFTPSQGGRRHFGITPDGTTVVYRADARIDQRFELFAAPITGGGPAVMLHNPLGPGLQIHPDFQLLSDSERVLYRGPPNATQLPVWLTRLDGTGGYRRLTDDTLQPFSVESGFAVTPDERRVVYRADLDTPGTTELYAFPLRKDARPAPAPGRVVGRSTE